MAVPEPTRLVFSDVDETLLTRKSLFDFLDYYFTRRYGAAGARHVDQTRRCLTALAAAGAPRERGNLAYYRAWEGQHEASVAESARRWFVAASAEKGFYRARTRAELRRHQAEGGLLVLVSGGFPALLEPVAADIGARHLVCTNPEVREGRYTGGVVGDPVIGVGKGAAVRHLIGAYPHLGPQECYGYGDHVSDLPMLAEVGHPVVVGADPALLAALPAARVLPD
ncbi:HAD family hydrolase [Kitasatospora sp. NPDC088548]|uniref:HAD family hydrolase n=1 Tax=Kitasatospora sp. NPDC088548 TaxID=3364075 RepID=UPI0037F36A01